MEWEEDTELAIADQPGQDMPSEVTFHPCPQYTQLGALIGRVGAKGKGMLVLVCQGDMFLPLASLNDQAGGDHGVYLIPPPCVTEEGIEALASLPVCDRSRTRASSPGCFPRMGAEML